MLASLCASWIADHWNDHFAPFSSTNKEVVEENFDVTKLPVELRRVVLNELIAKRALAHVQFSLLIRGCVEEGEQKAVLIEQLDLSLYRDELSEAMLANIIANAPLLTELVATLPLPTVSVSAFNITILFCSAIARMHDAQ